MGRDSFSAASFRRSPRRYDTPEMRNSKTRLEFSPLLRTTRQASKGEYSSGRGGGGNTPETPGMYNDTGVLSFDQVSDSMESFNPKESKLGQKDGNSGIPLNQDKQPNMLSELPLKEQEKAFQAQKNEIFGLQFKIYLLEQHLDKTSPENVQKTIKENVELKAELMHLRQEMQKKDKQTDTSELEGRIRTLQMDKEDLEFQGRQKDREVDELKDRIDELERERERGGNNNDSTNDDNNSNEEELEDLRYQLRRQEQEKDDEIEDLKQRIAQLEHEVEEQQDSGEQDDRISQLERELKKAEEVRDSVQSELEDKQNEAYQTKVDLESRISEIKEQETTIRNQQDRIQQLLDERRETETRAKQEVSRTIEDREFDFEQEKRNLEWQVKSKEDQVESLRQSRDEACDELSLVKKELLDTQNELSNVKLLLTRCNNDISGLKSEKEDLERQLADAKATTDHLRESSRVIPPSTPDPDQVDKLRGELDALRNQFSTKESNWSQEKTYLEDKISSLERMKDSYEKQLSSILQDDKSKEGLQQAIETEKNRHVEMKRGLEQEISRLQTQIGTLKGQLEGAQKETENHKKKVKELEVKVQEMDDDLVVSSSQLDEVERQKNNALAQVSGLQTSLKSQENTLNAMRDINQRESQTRRETQERLQTTEARERELISQCESLKSRVTQLEFERESLQERYDYSVNKKLETATSAAEEAQRKLAQIEAERDKLLAASATPKKPSTPGGGVADKEYRKLVHQINTLKRKEQLTRYDVDHYKEGTQRLKRKLGETTDLHRQHIQKMVAQMRYLKEFASRQTAYRFDLGFMKSFFLKQISMYQAFNRADLAILQDMGIYPDYRKKSRTKPKFKHVALAVLAAVRLKTRHDRYVEHRSKRVVLKKRS
ncbi:hypothetical protein TRICI_005608 [Trichomonascus ciferrii]|uniref:Centrosomin N-terminal motif 1 domain-containing protein n=1 Tax=Trichomonascus ciferrii TaxID=44093 RepID=A0A642URE3_9ASCO|nr:hypothetical protein TRICI_005608 [Trichomonascus ciferrii]